MPATGIYDRLPNGFIRVLRVMPDECPTVGLTERRNIGLPSANIPE